MVPGEAAVTAVQAQPLTLGSKEKSFSKFHCVLAFPYPSPYHPYPGCFGLQDLVKLLQDLLLLIHCFRKTSPLVQEFHLEQGGPEIGDTCVLPELSSKESLRCCFPG